jgi:tetratricopeptide (TPR) repeat protein
MSAAQERKLGQAAAALAAGDHPVAERLCAEILERAPRHPRALHLAALARRGQGDSAGARAFLRRALESDPRNLEAMKQLGAAELEAGDYVQAESWLRRALALGGGDASALCWLGLSLSSQGRHPEAVEFFRQVVAAEPEDAGLRLNLGNELMKIGAADEAIASYERALKLQPSYPEALNGLGVALQAGGEQEDAVARFRQAISLRPDYAEAHDNLGDALLRLGREQEAATCLRRAIALEPDNADFHSDLGNALLAQCSWDEAIAQYEHALGLKPDYPEALNSLASALIGRERFDDAIARLQQAIALRPDYAEAHDNLGFVLMQLGREEDATSCFRRAIALQPESAALRAGYGNALMSQNFWDGAAAQYRRALELNPDPLLFADVQYSLALMHLFRHEFEQAWPDFERRFETGKFRKTGFRIDPASVELYDRLPHWRGPGEAGVSEVAIWAEQGIGDQVLFSTLIPELIGAGVPFVYEVDRRLVGAYERAFPGARLVAWEEPPHGSLKEASRALAAGSLPGLFRRARDDFARQPAKLLSALPERVAYYRQRLEALGRGLKVALSWRSTRQDWWVRKKKSSPLADFAPLLTLAGVHFVDVQYGDTAAERGAAEQALGVRLLRFEEVDYYNDLEELLAILEACDLLITTSNATAHFAGALGKRTWLLYLADRAPFHYWVHGGSYRCLWYPSVEIVTAPQLTDWNSLAGYVAKKLEQEMAEAGAGASVASSPR